MPANKHLLKAKIAEKGSTQSEVANYLGISKQSFSYKINGVRDFKLSEIEKICNFLNISDKEPIFFNQK